MYGIKNLQRIVPNLLQWTKEENKDYAGLQQLYDQVSGQFQRYSVHVARNVGGVMLTPKMVEEAGPVYENVPKAKQKEAVDFLNKNVFATPTWLLNNDIFSRTGGTGTITIGNIQNSALSRLFSSRTLDKLVDAEASQGANVYTLTEMLADLKKGVWSELTTAKVADVYRRNLQKGYVSILTSLLNPQMISTPVPGFVITLGGLNDRTDARSLIRAHLVALRAEIAGAGARSADAISKSHFLDLADRISKALDPK